jgi:hypothetical protein
MFHQLLFITKFRQLLKTKTLEYLGDVPLYSRIFGNHQSPIVLKMEQFSYDLYKKILQLHNKLLYKHIQGCSSCFEHHIGKFN